jgi:cell wall-associated NlpC family hydrolase
VSSNNFSNYNIINVYNKKSIKSGLVTQILYGEKFKIISKYRKWCKIKLQNDGYKGNIIKKKFISKFKPTHKVCSISAALYSKPLSKYKINNKLSFGSKIKVVEKKSNFCKFDNLWIKKKDLKKIDYRTKDIFKNINKFINTKYKWGGKHFTGIDCSGLVQLFYNFNNKFCPRDVKDQINYFKKKIKLKNIRKNDLIFWKGHVAVAISKHTLIHAYGPSKKTLLMPINKTINKIYKTANLKVIGIRRVA